jgi:isopentenyl-diphosphate delta-isomerase
MISQKITTYKVMNEELIVLVNDQNEQIGTMPKLEGHTADTPLHRAFSCYVFNEKGEFLVTQRAATKKVWPGVWTNSCCGHPGPGESTEDAIKRRLAYELGLEPQTIDLVLPDFRYRAEFNGIVENEICPVYIAHISQEPQPNPEEVETYRWTTWETFKKEITDNPEGYSYWCVKQVEQMKDIFLPLK